MNKDPNEAVRGCCCLSMDAVSCFKRRYKVLVGDEDYDPRIDGKCECACHYEEEEEEEEWR